MARAVRDHRTRARSSRTLERGGGRRPVNVEIVTLNQSGPPELACPRCSGTIRATNDAIDCEKCGRIGRFAEGVWDFVCGRDYAASFGDEWKRYSRTQLDSHSGLD